MEITSVNFADTGAVNVGFNWAGASRTVKLGPWAPPLKGQRFPYNVLVAQVLARSDVVSDLRAITGAPEHEIRAALDTFIKSHR